MSKDDVPSSEKVHIVKIEIEGGKVDRRRVVLGSTQHRSGRACKTNLVRGGSDEDPPIFKSVRWFEKKKQ